MSHVIQPMNQMHSEDSITHLSLNALDQIALGSQIAGVDPELLCLKDANCCFGVLENAP